MISVAVKTTLTRGNRALKLDRPSNAVQLINTKYSAVDYSVQTKIYTGRVTEAK